jgi:FAD/FMN-containing dehydrogenase
MPVLTRRQTGVAGYVRRMQLWLSCLMPFTGSSSGEVLAGSVVSMASLSITSSKYAPSRQHALSYPDNLYQATIVTADGTARTVSDSENSDLFWGIRGGGSNFGVCTEFVLRLHPQRRTVFAGLVVFPPPVLDDLLKEVSEWWKTVKDHEAMHLIFGKNPDGHVSDG